MLQQLHLLQRTDPQRPTDAPPPLTIRAITDRPSAELQQGLKETEGKVAEALAECQALVASSLRAKADKAELDASLDALSGRMAKARTKRGTETRTGARAPRRRRTKTRTRTRGMTCNKKQRGPTRRS